MSMKLLFSIVIFVLCKTITASSYTLENELSPSKWTSIYFQSESEIDIKSYQKEVSKFTSSGKIDAAIQYSIRILSSTKKDELKTVVLIQLADLYYSKNDFKECYKYLEKLNRDTIDEIYYNRIGELYNDINDYENALGYFNEYLTASLKKKDTSALITVYLNLGDLSNKLKINEKALEYYNTSLKYSKKTKNYRAMSAAYNNITTIEIKNEDYESALDKLLESKELITKISTDELTRKSIDYNIASVHIALNHLDVAKPILDEIISFTQKTNQKRLYPYCLVALAEINDKQTNYKETARLLNKALEESALLKNDNLSSEINLRLSEVYEKLNRYKIALKHYRDYKQLNDSINEQIKSSDLIALQSKLDITQYKKDLQIRNQKIDYLELQSEKSTFIFTLLGISILLLLLLVLRQFNTIKLKKKNEAYASEINTLKEIQLEKEVEFKSNQVTDFAIQIQEQNSVLLKLKNSLTSILNNNSAIVPNPISQEIKDLSYDINSKISLNNEKIQLNTDVNESSERFLLNLKQKFPKLSQKEIKVCTLIRLNYNTKQIANQLGIAEHSIHNYRYNIRKKCQLDKNTQLEEFLNRI